VKRVKTLNGVIVSGAFDDLRSGQVRFLEEAARRGPVHVLLWSDDAVRALQGAPPKFPQAERQYLLEAIRYVDRVTLSSGVIDLEGLASAEGLGIRAPREAWSWGSEPEASSQAPAADSQSQIPNPQSPIPVSPPSAARKRVIVTGCYDWLHSGHVRFFEEVSALGDLYVVVGHDANIRLLKGEGHPMFPQEERRYMVQAVRYVTQALVATGDGWLDAEPEIERIKPHIYAVNEDGDRPEKREYCQAHGIEYRVLKRVPKEGLPWRESTALRGF
jgi:cytidyltransferase-like protein